MAKTACGAEFARVTLGRRMGPPIWTGPNYNLGEAMFRFWRSVEMEDGARISLEMEIDRPEDAFLGPDGFTLD